MRNGFHHPPLRAFSRTLWIEPLEVRRLFATVAGAFTPSDPKVVSQDYLTQIRAQQAWNTARGSSNIVVAVLDDGLWLTHEDINSAVWTNSKEIAGDGIDNDKNGFIDDIHGWNFGDGNNNVVPAYNSTYNFIETHGTIIAGIIGATMNNGLGIAGIAGGVKIMPVKFNGFGVNVTSTMLANAIIYATNNGARIINVSYSIDHLANDSTLNAALTYAYNRGVLYFGSAGNANMLNTARTSLERAMFVANVDRTDKKYVDSNYGTGIDLSAPGVNDYSIYSSTSNNTYSWGTGTSFSTAVVSGVAALVWSAHPTWTRDQVAAQIIGSADAIDALNPAFAGLLGSGRVNAFRAVGATIGSPKINSIIGLPANGASIVAAPTSISLDIRNVLQASTITSSAFELRCAGKDGVFSTGDDVLVTLSQQNAYYIGTNRLNFSVGAMPAGKYRFTAKASIRNPFDKALDGNGDGIGGDALVRTFTYSPAAVPGVAPPISPNIPWWTNTLVMVQWTDASSNETGFIVERATDANFTTGLVRTLVPANTQGYMVQGLTPLTTYYFRIRAVNSSGESSPSATVSTRTLAT